MPLKTIKFKVNNQDPTIETTKIPKVPLKLTEVVDRAVFDDDLVDVSRDVYIVGKDNTLSMATNFQNYFKDLDSADKGKLNLTIKSASPQYAVVAAYKTDGSAVYVDVINSPVSVNKIYLNVTASDGTASSGLVMIPIELPASIRTQKYPVSQDDALVKNVLVDYRPGQTHMITGLEYPVVVGDPDVGSLGGYEDTVPTGVPTIAETNASVEITAVTVSGVRSIKIKTATDAEPGEIRFTTSSLGRASVTVNTHTAVAATIDPVAAAKWTTETALKFTVTVSIVTEDPVRITVP